MIETIGWLGGFFFAICGIPQAWGCYKAKNADGLTHGFLWSWVLGEVFTLFYILAQDNLLLPLVANYIFNLLSLLIIMYYKYRKYIWNNMIQMEMDS